MKSNWLTKLTTKFNRLRHGMLGVPGSILLEGASVGSALAFGVPWVSRMVRGEPVALSTTAVVAGTVAIVAAGEGVCWLLGRDKTVLAQSDASALKKWGQKVLEDKERLTATAAAAGVDEGTVARLAHMAASFCPEKKAEVEEAAAA